MAYTNYIYEGAGSSLEPSEFYTGYKIPAGSIGATTSIQAANQAKEVTNLLNQGIKNVEVSMIKPDVFDMISNQQLKEIRRIGKLTGSEATFHAPIIDPSGYTQQGWDEATRKSVEHQFISIAERAHELNPDGNIPVTIHATGSVIGGSDSIEVENPDTGKMEEVTQNLVAVNRENGKPIYLSREFKFHPEKKYEMIKPREELNRINQEFWANNLSQLSQSVQRSDWYGSRERKQAEAEVGEVSQQLNMAKQQLKSPHLNEEQKKELQQAIQELQPTFNQKYQEYQQIKKQDPATLMAIEDTHRSIRELFSQAYKFTDSEGQKQLQEASNKFKSKYNQFTEETSNGRIKVNDADAYSRAMGNLINDMLKVTHEHTPKVYTPVEDFVKEKASQTIAGTALAMYNKFGPTAPIMSIENPPYGEPISRAQDLKELIERSRKEFVKKAIDDGMGEGEARNAAEKLIGATWDTSHNAMMRKQGFKAEKLTEEAKIIAPFVKHVHLNDNFGAAHVDLPPGMGNVPIKDIMKELEKAGYEGKQVFEGGNFFQQYQTSPHPYMLEAFGGAMPRYGGYFAGYGTMLPEQHFSMYGAGFSGLPTELGGQIQQKGSRMSGTPMA